MFTKYNSLNQILAYPRMQAYLNVLFSEYNLSLFPPDMADDPLALVEAKAKNPWDEPFSVTCDQLIDAANTVLEIEEYKTRRCLNLWKMEDFSPENYLTPGVDRTFLMCPTQVTDKEVKPCLLIVPGGGYRNVCFSGEGNPLMKFFEAQGCRTFALRYRTCPDLYPAPQQDLSLAIQYLRKNADWYGIDPNNITTLGFSAGGHLCASQAAEPEKYAQSGEYAGISAKPNKVGLGYPVISFTSEQHEGSFQDLTGNNESLRQQLSAENMVREDYPPTFLWTCMDDTCVPPSNAVRMDAALAAKGIPHRLCAYPTGEHGCALAFRKSASGWSREFLNFLKES